MEKPQSIKVLVTGATGYIASWIVKYLLEEGYNVIGTVRDKSDKNTLKLRALTSNLPGSLSIVEANLLKEGSFDEAIKDCSVVFHTASPFKTKFKNADEELLKPALIGTQNILSAVNKYDNIKRVVHTSSCAAILGDNKDLFNYPNQIADESCWNVTSSEKHNPYSFSKVLAEQYGWRLHGEQSRWSLVTINPSLVIGPSCIDRFESESFQMMKQYLSGAFLFGVPDYSVGLVDVRDVAKAHIKVAFSLEHQGRYIISATNTNLSALGRALKLAFPSEVKFINFKVPRIVIALIGRFISKVMTYRFVMNNIGYPWKTSNQKSIRELGIQYREAERSAQEMIQQVIDSRKKR
jgi:dihydroflavonol-4-reductase